MSSKCCLLSLTSLFLLLLFFLLVQINLDEFADLSHAIGLRFQKEDSVNLLSMNLKMFLVCTVLTVLVFCRNLFLRAAALRSTTHLHL